jgi:hypothetical protein
LARRNSTPIKVYVTPEERSAIERNAKACALSASKYLCNVGCGHLPKDKLDQKAILDLMDASADLGRLGGLLKMWLSNDERLGALDIRKLYTEILSTQADLKAKIREII